MKGPTPITALLAISPKLQLFAYSFKFLSVLFRIIEQWQQIIIFISIASMILGAVAALMQTKKASFNIVRLGIWVRANWFSFSKAGISGVLIYLIYTCFECGNIWLYYVHA